MHLTERMLLAPARCLYCGRGNVADADEGTEPGPFLDLERDVNWGDSVYLCGKCVALAAGLFDYVSETEVGDLRSTLASRDEEIHDLKSQLELRDKRWQAIEDGRQALRDERKAKVA